jgi:uncharacterized protein YyaL (SSP411 family)
VHTNRLSGETSPYLLQHQHNPVDWYPWGPDAFAAAVSQNKPIFLSVGYSTCYWCHVMERQCFENEAIAAEMNQRFISIKVDREERPDVDQLFMTAVQLLTRHGGWPMSVFLLPDLRPFYGGTYFPPTDQHGRPGFVTVLRAIDDAFKNRRDAIEESADQLVGALRQLAEPPTPTSSLRIDDDFIATQIARSTADYEPQFGGFGSAPKFPRQTLLQLLLAHNRNFPDAKRMAMLTHTLDAMAYGGIRDQLGGGFHRYSTDAQWLVPHFEIMLYDNALLAECYVEAFVQTREARYAAVARGIFDFVLREMTDSGGGFYTAFDAEVDAQEGLSYLWTRAEVVATLKDSAVPLERIDRFCRIYGLDDGPNFADPHHGSGRAEKNILFLSESGPTALLDLQLASLREILYAARGHRKQPLLDTKIITSWNALMIRALANGATVLGEPKYLQAAERAAEFLTTRHRDQDGGLLRTSRNGVAKYQGFLDDYSFLIDALLALPNSKWKKIAGELSNVMARKFADARNGGFFFSPADATDLIVRQKIGSDSPLPAGNALAVTALIGLGDPEAAKKTIEVFAQQMSDQGEGMSAMGAAAAMFVQKHGPIEVSPGSNVDRPISPTKAARDIVLIAVHWDDPLTLRVRLRIAAEYHINANRAAKGLIPTQLSVVPAAMIEYPAVNEMKFEGEVILIARFSAKPIEDVRLTLVYQACNDRSCLPAVSKQIDVALP